MGMLAEKYPDDRERGLLLPTSLLVAITNSIMTVYILLYKVGIIVLFAIFILCYFLQVTVWLSLLADSPLESLLVHHLEGSCTSLLAKALPSLF